VKDEPKKTIIIENHGNNTMSVTYFEDGKADKFIDETTKVMFKGEMVEIDLN